MNICLFSQDEIERPLSLRDPRGEHLVKILHKKEGESFSAGIIDGPSGTATITKIKSEEVPVKNGKKTILDGEISFTFTPTGDGKPLYPLKMIIGFPRPIQLKRLMRDLAGLGVCEIHLTGTELGEKSYLKSDLAQEDAGRELLLEGTVQAASTHVPKLYKHESLKECLDFIHKAEDFNAAETCLYCLDNINPTMSLWDSLTEQKPCNAIAAIGSERGWTQNERELLENYGYKRMSMGIRVLRTESASTVAGSLILGAMGKLN